MSVLYFSYGSNMLTARLVARCASARVVGRAFAPGHRFEFSKYSWMDGSGKATLRPGGRGVDGVLWEIAAADMPRLDAAEGLGKGYDRLDDLPVQHAGTRLNSTTYLATKPENNQRPYDWYLALCLAGALEHGMPGKVISALRDTAFDIDVETDRPVRQIALQALETSGLADWRTVLLRA